ncbi:sigma factor [Levilactobacillus yonginensis]|uniref:sigma factor n=1 Tax=Levilactobacillus yonginensis TaxID=1054041 RepID=UPI00345D4DF2
MNEMSNATLLVCLQDQLDSPALHILFERYRPVLKKLQQRYFIVGFDQDDWDQEARVVFCRSIKRFDATKAPNFGAFYRLNLRHRVFDLIRRSKALKRQQSRKVISLEANSDYFADTLEDSRWAVREQLEVQDAVQRVQESLSGVEHTVFNGLLRGETLLVISQRKRLPYRQVTAASHRSQVKLRRLLAE